MTIEELFEKLEDAPYVDYIVRLKYKYDWETEYTYDNVVLGANGCGDWIWSWDWNEGQTDVEVIGFMAVDEVPIIESRPKGKWEDFSCSLCGFTPLIKPMAIDTTKGLIMCTYKYCPSCGAEMECEE